MYLPLSVKGLVSGLLLSTLGAAHPSSENSELEVRGPGSCHGPKNRGCWSPGFDINTDYEKKIPQGKTVKYHWDVTEHYDYTTPDGIEKSLVMLVDGKMPGPVLEADWGDNIEVTISNKLKWNGTSIHWHGIRMLKNNINDGANGVTECPIPPGSSKTYKFRAEQYGSSWYHSHYSAQYGNGVFGSVVIHGPASSNYDIDLGAYPIFDVYSDTADKIVEDVLVQGFPPDSANMLFNGKNVSPDGTKGDYSRLTFTPGKKHLLRLINPSAEHHYQVSIVNHDLTIVSTDFVPVKPIKTDNVFLGVGQRVDVIIEAKQKTGNYWLNATLYSEANNFCGTSANKYPAAIVQYKGARKENPKTQGTKPANSNCQDRRDYQPVVKRTVPTRDFKPSLANTLDMVFPGDSGLPFLLWEINGSSIRVNWDRPVLEYVLEGNTSYPTQENLVHVNQKDVWTYWLIENGSGLDHPMHLHGHDLYVLGVSDGAATFTEADIPKLRTDNPVRRDTAMVAKNGWLLIAFKADNPGNWLFHCHIAWHIAGGLGVDFMERVSEQSKLISSAQRKTFENECTAWGDYWEESGLSQPDSGLRKKPVGIPSGV